jgi:hypothetical protein
MTADSYFWLVILIVSAINYGLLWRYLMAGTREPRTHDTTDCDESREGDRAAEPERP